MPWRRSVRAFVSSLAFAVSAACGSSAFTVAQDGGASDASSSSDAPNASDASSGDTACESRADPRSACSLSSAACTRTALSTPTAPSHVFSITTDATHVYWSSQVAYNSPSLGGIYRVAKSGGATEVVADNQPGPLSVTLDSKWIYWITQGLAGADKTVLRVPKACSGPCPVPEAVFSGPIGDDPSLHTLGEEDLFVGSATANFRRRFDPLLPGWRSGSVWPAADRPSTAASRYGIFLGAGARKQVDRISQDGATSQLLFHVSDGDGGPFPGAIRMATDCTSLFVLRDSVADIRRVSIADPSIVTPIVPATLRGVYALAVDETFLYIGVSNGPGLLRTVKKGGGPVDTLLAGSVWAITTDDTAVYWGDHETGVIYRLIK